MGKIRVHEYAKNHNVSSKEIIAALEKAGIEVSNHMSILEEGQIKKLNSIFEKGASAKNTSSGEGTSPSKENVKPQKEAVKKDSPKEKVETTLEKPKTESLEGSKKPTNSETKDAHDEKVVKTSRLVKTSSGQWVTREVVEKPPTSKPATPPAATTPVKEEKVNVVQEPKKQEPKKEEVVRAIDTEEKPERKNEVRPQGQRPKNTAPNRPQGPKPGAKRGNVIPLGRPANPGVPVAKTSTDAFDDDYQAGPSIEKVKTAPKIIEQKKASPQQGNFSRGNTRNQGKNKHRQFVQTPVEPKKEKELPKKITFTESLTVAEFAKKIYREPAEIIKKLFLLGVVATINNSLDKDAIELIASEYGIEV
jgi:translation initiation factor IF-2